MNINFSQVATSYKHCLNFDYLTCYRFLGIDIKVGSSELVPWCVICDLSVYSLGFLQLDILLVSQF